MPSVLIPLASGFEELEAITLIDLLRRAGIEVLTAGLAPGEVRASHGTVHVPDIDLDSALTREYDMVVLPGGLPGSDHLAEDPRVVALVKKMSAAGQFTAAICAAPRVLVKAGILAGKRITAYPGCIDPKTLPKITLLSEAVVRDGTVITSRGPGTAMDFALTLIEALTNFAVRKQVEEDLYRP
ncbi:protein deglycase [Gammaproteobacteria bacterium]